ECLMNCKHVLLSLAAWATAVGVTQAGALVQRTLLIDRPTNHFTSTTFDLDWAVTDAYFSSARTNTSTLFDDLQISPEDVGQTFTADVDGEPAFRAVAARLTDAEDEILDLILDELASDHYESRGLYESGFFMPESPTEPPDLAGFVIESVDLTIDSFRLDFTPASSPTNSSPPPVELVVTIAVNGRPIPEPQSWALAACSLGGAGFLIFAQRRQRERRRRHAVVPAVAQRTR
ncbi:MAG: hypothetical protein AAF961_03640, partial [Planctomycetota bacterium]